MALQNKNGYLYLAIAQCALGLNVVTSKCLIKIMPIFFMMGVRFFCSSMMLILAVVVLKKPLQSDPTAGPLGFRLSGALVLQALTGGWLFNLLFLQGMAHTTATAASIIGSTLPVLIAVFAFFLLGERLTKTKMLALILALLGILIINVDNTQLSEHGSASLWGNFLIFLAMLPEALYSIISKFIGHKINPLTGAMVINCLSFLMFIPFMLTALQGQDITLYSYFDWFLVILGAGLSVLFYWCWSQGLVSIQATTAALFSGLMPVATTIGAFLWLDETFTVLDGLGLLLVILSIMIGAKKWQSYLQLFPFFPTKTINEVPSAE